MWRTMFDTGNINVGCYIWHVVSVHSACGVICDIWGVIFAYGKHCFNLLNGSVLSGIEDLFERYALSLFQNKYMRNQIWQIWQRINTNCDFVARLWHDWCRTWYVRFIKCKQRDWNNNSARLVQDLVNSSKERVLDLFASHSTPKVMIVCSWCLW